ncbi:hypothetical protein GCM10025777_46330 [Membranihabitans marinus]
MTVTRPSSRALPYEDAMGSKNILVPSDSPEQGTDAGVMPSGISPEALTPASASLAPFEDGLTNQASLIGGLR